MNKYPFQKINTQEMLARYADGENIEEIARRFGVTRAAVSLALIKQGISPAARRSQRKQERAERRELGVAQRRIQRTQRAADRLAAVQRLRALADELYVSPNTLGQYAAMSGPYAKQTHYRRLDTQILPYRHSPAGEALARRIEEVCAPFKPHYLGNIS